MPMEQDLQSEQVALTFYLMRGKHSFSSFPYYKQTSSLS